MDCSKKDNRIRKYRKKPIEIEAIKWDGRHDTFLHLVQQWTLSLDREIIFSGEQKPLKIHTLEGIMEARVGDYIIRGIKGEIYPCKPDIFSQTYFSDSSAET